MSRTILEDEEKMWTLFAVTAGQLPELTDAYYGPVREAVYADGALDTRTKRLLALAVAIQAGCRECMISQTAGALDAGATVAEIFESCSVAVSMGGTLAWSRMLLVAEYLQARGLLAGADSNQG